MVRYGLWAALWTACGGRFPIAGDAADVAADATLQDWHHGGQLQKGRGCTVADFDGDGRPDLALANPADVSHILLNRSEVGEWRFEPGPVLSDTLELWALAAADIDGDGDIDMFGAAGGLEAERQDRLWRNERIETGTLAFTEIGQQAGLRTDETLPTASLAAQWIDFDGDGDLDIWVDSTPWPRIAAEPDASELEGRNQLWRNEGDGTFRDVAGEVGFDASASSRFSSWLDIDGDGDFDLYENRMRLPLSVLWRNDGGTFVDVTAEASLDGGDVAMPPETFVSTTADFNNDGWDDLLLFVRGWPTDGPSLLGHTMLLNVAGRGFVDVTSTTQINAPFLSGLRDHQGSGTGVMGATARDINGDGTPDLFFGNGGPLAGGGNALYFSVGMQTLDLGPEVGVVDVPVYENRTELIDTPALPAPDAPEDWPPFPYRTHAACVADFDGDGAVEMYVSNGGVSWGGGDAAREPNRLFVFRPDPDYRHLNVVLRGDGQNVPWTPVGTRIAVEVAEGDQSRIVRDTLRTIEGFSAQHGLTRWMGLGAANSIVRVEIAWPDGHVDTLSDVTMDTTIEVLR